MQLEVSSITLGSHRKWRISVAAWSGPWLPGISAVPVDWPGTLRRWNGC